MSKRGNAEWPDKKIIAAKLQLRKLFDQRRDPEWPNWAVEIGDVRLELRKLLDRYPKAPCHHLMAYIKTRAREAVNRCCLPNPRKEFPGGSLAQLLADYRNALDLGWGRLDYFKKTAEDGWHRGSVGVLEGSYNSGTWRIADAIEAQLKRAEALVKIDPDFAEDVAFWQDCLADKYLGAVLWGRKNA